MITANVNVQKSISESEILPLSSEMYEFLKTVFLSSVNNYFLFIVSYFKKLFFFFFVLFQIWNAHDMFSSSKSAEHFQGILDTAFMVAYAIVSISGVFC